MATYLCYLCNRVYDEDVLPKHNFLMHTTVVLWDKDHMSPSNFTENTVGYLCDNCKDERMDDGDIPPDSLHELIPFGKAAQDRIWNKPSLDKPGYFCPVCHLVVMSLDEDTDVCCSGFFGSKAYMVIGEAWKRHEQIGKAIEEERRGND